MLEGSAVINSFGRFTFLLLGVAATHACAKTVPTDVKKETERVRGVVCSQTMLADVERALVSLKLAYHISDAEKQLNAIKRYDEDQLVSSAITVTVGFASDKNVTNCKVEIVYTGP